jgi:threonine dehydratase
LPVEAFLKLENLQYTGSFKVRGAGNAILKAASSGVSEVWTASAGNMGLAVAWYAKRLGMHCSVIVPDDAPAEKTDAIKRLDAEVLPLPREEYWGIQKSHRREGMSGLFIHPFADPDVMAGNGTIALEILEELPDVDAVIVPYGGGGLSCGIASIFRELQPNVTVYAAETENGAPLAPSLERGQRVEVPYWKSFVSGIGSPVVFSEMWSLAHELLADSIVVRLEQTLESMALLLRYDHVLAEGAGAVSLAAAQSNEFAGKRVVCIISGGNIDFETAMDLFREHNIR